MFEITTDLSTLIQNVEMFRQLLGNPKVTLTVQPQSEDKELTPKISKDVSIKMDDVNESSELPCRQKIQDFHDLLIGQLEQKIPSAQEAARELGLSCSQFRRLFTLMYQDSYYHYFLNQKMGRAKMYLESGGFSVKELAALFGYSQTIKFVTIFKKHVGITPGRLKGKRIRC